MSATRTPSEYQKAIYEFVLKGRGNGIVSAVPGSGKTTTLVDIANLLPRSNRALFLSFNKSIAEELARRLPAHVESSTINAWGARQVRRALKARGEQVEVDDYKVLDLARQMIAAKYPQLADDEYLSWPERKRRGEEREAVVEELHDLTEMAMMTLPHFKYYGSEKSLAWVAEQYDLEKTQWERTWPLVIDVIRESFRLALKAGQHEKHPGKYVVTFKEQYVLPQVLNWPVEQYDWVFVDEAQDLNRVQLELILRAIKPRYGRILFVGDRHQSIYLFAGADTKSMDRAQRATNATEFPLPISYRMDAALAAHCSTLYPGVLSRPGAAEGKISYIDYDLALNEITAPDRVLCRTSAPLIEMAYALIREGKPVQVLGREIGENLVGLLKKIMGRGKTTKWQSFDERLERHIEKKQHEFERSFRPEKVDEKMDALMDQVMTLQTIIAANDCDSQEATIAAIYKIFPRKEERSRESATPRIVLSTIHKAKGLEADRCFILGKENMPSKWAKTEQQLQQEKNLEYVAFSRAKHNVYVIAPRKRD